MFEKAPLGELMLGIIDRPGRTLANVVAYPRWRWLLPVLLMVAALAASLVITEPLLAARSQQAIADQMARMSASQAAQVQQTMATFQSPAFIIGSGLAGVLIATVIGWLIQAALLYFGSLVAGSDLAFKGILAAAPWLGVPFVFETILQTIWAQVRGQLLATPGLSALVATGNTLQDARNLAYVALSEVTLFRLWHLVLVYALFRVAARLGRGSALWLTVVYFLLLLGGTVGLAAIGHLLSPR
jgi:hypothetical protein